MLNVQMMRKFSLLGFHTGLMASDYWRFPRSPYRGNGWQLDFVLPPDKLRFGSEHVGNRIYPAKEVVIWASSEAKAQRAADLIHASRLSLDGSNALSHIGPGEHLPIRPTKTKGTDSGERTVSDSLSQNRLMTPNIPLACLVAARASFRLRYAYALAKLRLSFDTFSVHWVDLDPLHGENLPKSPLPEDHVRMAFAMVAAYSSIEELGLEIRASEKKPSKLRDGSWNPVVKSELEEQLRRGHINLKERFLWNLRGPQTRIERRRKPNLVLPAKWARYLVRDGEMEIIDSLHYVSFLRSSVAAHKSDTRMVSVLSAYDVANAQMLARRLMLENMGYWRYWGDRRR